MIFPNLEPVARDREYNQFSEAERDKVIYEYLFNDRSHRWLDEHVLRIEADFSRGYMSMGTLHHIGIKGVHKGVFKANNLSDAIEILQKQDAKQFKIVILALQRCSLNGLNDFNYNESNLTLEGLNRSIEEEIKKSQKDNRKQRRKRLKEANPKAITMNVITIAYKRNADVIIEVLERANGICERCNNLAPFIRASDGTPYLEVHHKILLSEGGDDTVENAIAVCPNCHRELHFGAE